MTSVFSPPGFDFSNTLRNNFFAEKGLPLPKATSTGTTIVGCLFEDGIVLGADTRATEGPDCCRQKLRESARRPRHSRPILTSLQIHYITDNIRCCGAGTAADTEFTTALISSNMELHSLSTGRKPRVVTAMTMLKQMLFRYQGQVGAALVLGGVDATGPHLFTIHPHGSTDKLPYVTMGSGSLAAMAVFESGWKANMSREAALQLVKDAISAGIFNDLGSGSNVDACIITASHTEMLRNVEMPNIRVQKERQYGFRRGTTAWKTENIRSLVVSEEVTLLGTGDEMDTT
ncbi:20S proteasome subunit [Mycena olivaceomarginata]|nr:20S proteasome subunit [Mycena olivaceomarginata]